MPLLTLPQPLPPQPNNPTSPQITLQTSKISPQNKFLHHPPQHNQKPPRIKKPLKPINLNHRYIKLPCPNQDPVSQHRHRPPRRTKPPPCQPRPLLPNIKRPLNPIPQGLTKEAFNKTMAQMKAKTNSRKNMKPYLLNRSTSTNRHPPP